MNEKLIKKYMKKYKEYIQEINKIHKDFTFKHSNDRTSEHRMKCFINNEILKNIIIEEFGDINNYKETVLIEFRPLPNLEFLIRWLDNTLYEGG